MGAPTLQESETVHKQKNISLGNNHLQWLQASSAHQ